MVERRIEEFITQLRNASSFVAHTSSELARKYGEPMEHLLLADVTRWAVRIVDASRSDERSRSEVLTVLGVLEHWYDSSDDRISNAIAVSFVENLPAPDEDSRLPELLGSKLGSSYERLYTKGLL
jgi:hypothetical protein